MCIITQVILCKIIIVIIVCCRVPSICSFRFLVFFSFDSFFFCVSFKVLYRHEYTWASTSGNSMLASVDFVCALRNRMTSSIYVQTNWNLRQMEFEKFRRNGGICRVCLAEFVEALRFTALEWRADCRNDVVCVNCSVCTQLSYLQLLRYASWNSRLIASNVNCDRYLFWYQPFAIVHFRTAFTIIHRTSTVSISMDARELHLLPLEPK